MTARIVVADDDADIRRLVAFTLRRRGYEVREAGAGDEALALILEHSPDLAVLDVMMPGMTGIEVARALTENPQTAHIPVVILSAKGQAAEVEAGMLSGARRYLVKPFAPQKLAEEVAAVLAEPAPAPMLDSPEPGRTQPVAGDPPAAAPAASESAAAPVGDGGDGRPPRAMHFLVVDDDPDINRLVRARLSARGFQAESASNGAEALDRIAQAAPDVIFLDVSMPVVGGLEVLERVRADGLDMAVIMMTAFGSEEVAIDALRRGADDYLRKPFEPREFQAVVERTVSRLELTRRNALLQQELDEKRRQLEAELAAAAEVQLSLLPRDYPPLPGFDLCARFLPAREVGGDFYDWQTPAPDVFSFTLGDVMGKGMPAALLSATARAVLRATAEQDPPAAAVQRAARALETDLGRSGSFLTLFHARLETSTGRLRFVDAGHGHVFICRAGGRSESLGPRGLPVGILPDERYDEGEVLLAPGDALVLYSDGLIDARPDLTLDQDSLARAIGDGATADAIVERLVRLAWHGQSLPDDLTVLAITSRQGG